MKQLEDFPALDKWLDDHSFDNNDIETQLMVVDDEDVQEKLIELGSEIEAIKLQLSEFQKDKNWTRAYNYKGELMQEHALYMPKLNKAY